MTLDRDKLFTNQREALKDHAEDVSPDFIGDYSQHIPISPEQGKGYFDFHHFDDFLLGRADCCFKKDANFMAQESQYSYGIHIMLSGELQVKLEKIQQNFTPKAPEIWLSKGDLGISQAKAKANTQIRNLLIEFSPDFLKSLGKDAEPNSLCQQLLNSQSPSFIQLPSPSAETINLSWKLYEYPGATSYLQLMAIQGAALSLVSHLLNTTVNSENTPSAAQQGALRAKKILDKDYHKRWSIRALARQAMTNECDLKREFKQLTSLTINHYQRKQRMQVALNLIENGENNLAKVADSIGYQSKDYFVRVFQQYYGFHPNSIRKITE